LYELQLIAIVAFGVATAALLLFYARTQKRKSAWILFSVAFALFAITGMLTLLNPIRSFWTENSQEFTAPFIAFIELIWLIAIVLFAKSDNEEQLEKQFERISAMNDIARSYLAASDLESAANLSLERIAKTFGAEGGSIFILDRTQKNVSTLASYGEIPPAQEMFTQVLSEMYSSDNQTSKDLDRTGKARKLTADLFKEAFLKAGIKSAVGAPIMVEGQTIGMMMLFSRRDIPLTKEGRDFLDLTAFELGLWMAQMKDFDEIKSMTEFQEGLLSVSIGLQQELIPEKITKSIVDELARLIPCRDVWVYLINPVKKTMWPAQAIGKDASYIMADAEFPISEAGLAGAVLKDGYPQIIPDSVADGRGRHIEGTGQESSVMLIIPLVAKGEAIGVIEMSRDLPATFTKRELEIGTLFAQQASIAMQNAKLLDGMEKEKDKSKLYLDLLTHDVANLNTPLYSYFDMMMKDEKLDAHSKDIMKKSYAQVERISTLLSRVRRLSKAELEEMEARKPCNPSEILQQSVHELRRAFPHRNIDVLVNDLEGKVFVAAGEMLDEVFFNILHNSVKYSPKDVQIDITLEEMELQGKWYCAVRFCDSGSGIPDDLKAQVFDKPKAAAASFARGFGIGLSTCKKLVEKYGGNIWVEDRVEGDYKKGACFVVTLPLIREKAAPQATRKLKDARPRS
jgi:signal transduction histidine kinase